MLRCPPHTDFFFSFHGQPLITRLQPHEGSVLNMYVCSNTGWLDHMLLVDSQGDYQAQQLYSCCLLAAFIYVCGGGSTHKGIDSWLLVKQIKAILNVFCVCRHVLLRTVAASATCDLCDLWCTVQCVFVLCVSQPHFSVSKVKSTVRLFQSVIYF